MPELEQERNYTCAGVRERFTHCLFMHTRTHMRLHRNMEAHTQMMSDSPASLPAFLPFLPSLAGVSPFSWEILGFPLSWCSSFNSKSSFRYAHNNSRKDMCLQNCHYGAIVERLVPALVLKRRLYSRRLLEKGGEAQGGLEYGRMRKSLQPGREQPLHCSLLWYFLF